ncbi:uncharacterized protein LOC127803935 [Diospyros lotus]|uniref:uncharacterized protein LOC127803935 n=1 Tax=Diospyros lotus TaxID=55363 RepID=UPI002256C026|nr:uncharacterized protein LOC127803935 [Diospyros lotus]
MSWLARSIANSLRLDDDDDHHNDGDNGDNSPNTINAKDDQDHQSDPPSGVKEDLSEITKTLTRQLWGVASFLAPPPDSESSPRAESRPSPSPQASDSSPREAKGAEAFDAEGEAFDAAGIAGLRSDFAEIGGKFRSGIFKLSNYKAVSEFTKIASNLLQLGPEQENYGSAGVAVGVTDEVVAFVRDIAMHPETWLDFPLPEDDSDDDDFDMSDAQQEHALAVEHLAPRLAALRIELCPGYMSESFFWKIYFVLLHPRLNKHDAELLSTPQIVKARALLTQELQKKTKAKPEENWSRMDMPHLNDIPNVPHEKSNSVPSSAQSESVLLETSAIEPATNVVDAEFETEKHPVQSAEIPIIDKSVIEERPVNWAKEENIPSDSSSRVMEIKYEDDVDDWLKEESAEIVGTGGTSIPIENEEDVSFSDLEEDDEDAPASYKKVTYGSDSSTKESRDWVQLSRSSSDPSKDISAVSVDRTRSEQVNANNPETKESNDWLDIDEIDVE